MILERRKQVRTVELPIYIIIYVYRPVILSLCIHIISIHLYYYLSHYYNIIIHILLFRKLHVDV